MPGSWLRLLLVVVVVFDFIGPHALFAKVSKIPEADICDPHQFRVIEIDLPPRCQVSKLSTKRTKKDPKNNLQYPLKLGILQGYEDGRSNFKMALCIPTKSAAAKGSAGSNNKVDIHSTTFKFFPNYGTGRDRNARIDFGGQPSIHYKLEQPGIPDEPTRIIFTVSTDPSNEKNKKGNSCPVTIEFNSKNQEFTVGAGEHSKDNFLPLENPRTLRFGDVKDEENPAEIMENQRQPGGR